MEWTAQVNKILEGYADSHLCLDCLAELLPNLQKADLLRTLRKMAGHPLYVSSYEAECGRCGREAIVYACD